MLALTVRSSSSITETERDMWTVRGVFASTPAFDAAVARLFAEKNAAAAAIEGDESAESLAAFDDIEERTGNPHFVLFDKARRQVPFGLLYVTGDFAGFRLV